MGSLPFILRLGVRVVCSLENASPFRARSLSSILVDVNAAGGVIVKLFLILLACPWPLGIETVSILVGPIAYLQLSWAEKSAPEDFDLLSLLDSILPVYKEVIRELKEPSPKWLQLDEPMLVLDPWAFELEAFKKAFFLPWNRPWWTIIGLEHVWAIGVDLVPGAKTLNLVKEFGLSGETLFVGLIDGHDIWADDLAVSVTVIEEFPQALGKGKVFI
ncbi:unnamed protein product [Sphagnum troendelagicum]